MEYVQCEMCESCKDSNHIYLESESASLLKEIDEELADFKKLDSVFCKIDKDEITDETVEEPMQDKINSAVASVSHDTLVSYFQPVDQLKKRVVLNAIKTYASDCTLPEVVSLMDETVFQSGKNGFLLTDKMLYGKVIGQKGWQLPLTNLRCAIIIDIDSDEECYMTAVYEDWTTQKVWTGSGQPAPYLCKVLNAIAQRTGAPSLAQTMRVASKLGFYAFEEKKYGMARARQLWTIASVLCEKGAIYGMGQSCLSVDPKEAFKWFMKAANQGDSRAQFEVGCAYYQGRGVKQDYEEAYKWLKKSDE